MRTRAICIIVALSPLPATAEDGKYVEVCDAVIASRQAHPASYKRLSETITPHIFTREEVIDRFIPKDRLDRLKSFDAGEWSPREYTIVIDYEATNQDSEIVDKRSVCEFTLSSADDMPEPDLVVVDGEMDAMRF